MAKAYATCTCKHCGKEFEVSAFKRNRKEAASWSDWAARTYDCCNECADRIRAEENARNAAEAKEMGLPELVGSPKQIAWAESIRMDMISAMDKAFEQQLAFLKARENAGKNIERITRDTKIIDLVRQYIFKNCTSAHWWIDVRFCDCVDLMHSVYKEHKIEFDKAVTNGAAEVDKDEEAEADKLITAMPENPCKDIADVYIAEEDKLCAKYPEKDDTFRSICKEYGMRWDPDNRVWARRLDVFSGDPEDRQADLVNRLLRKGFPVRCLTQTIADKAVNAAFAAERVRWIKRDVSTTGRLIWYPRSSDEYNAALRLPGVKGKEYYYVKDGKHGEITAPVHLHAAIEEYAEMYDYEFSDGAKEEIAEFESNKMVAQAATPKKIARPKPEAKLEEILNSSDEVLPDLEDTDETDH